MSHIHILEGARRVTTRERSSYECPECGGVAHLFRAFTCSGTAGRPHTDTVMVITDDTPATPGLVVQ